jgi:hypothetical protein
VRPLTLLLACCALTPSAAQGRPVFVLHTADGRSRAGTLREVGKDWSVELDGKDTVRARGDEVVTLRRSDLSLPPPPRGAQVVLANGDRLPGHALRLADERLEFAPDPPVKLAGDRPLVLPLSGVSVIWFAAPAGAGAPETLLRRLAAEERPSDLVLLRNGDRLEGTLQGIGAESVRVETEGKRRVEVPVAKVAAVAFNTDLVSRKKPKGPYGHLVLTSGGRLAVTQCFLGEAGRVLRCRLPTGALLDVPLDGVAALDVRQGCAVYLSDLRPKSYEHTPFFGVRWPYAADAAVAGRAITLGGAVYDKGLGLHTRSRLTYAVPKGCRAFEALVGMDAETGRRGRARVRVLVDGKPADLGHPGELTARDKALPVRVSLAGARELMLVVDFGRFGDVQGHVDWADARLIK